MDRKEQTEKMLDALIPWYEKCGRSLPWRESSTPYHVWISEIMLQQTRIETVIPYYTRFLQEIPDIKSLAEADPEHLHKLWEGLGYYSRVRNLQDAARQIMTQFNGVFPEKYEDILSLRGVGSYTAAAIASICFNLPTPAVDGNVLRVMSRITGDQRPISEEKTKKKVCSELAEVYPSEKAGVCTQAIMELGETVCLPNGVPDCIHCPCREFCLSSDGSWIYFPVKEEKKARRIEFLTFFILRCNNHTAIRKRPSKGLLAGMWELPNCPGHLKKEEVFLKTEEWGCEPSECIGTGTDKHIFTHIEWDIRYYSVSCSRMSPEFVWVDDEQLNITVSLPTAFRKVLIKTVNK
ncbi:MAG: A/G-specific adenine glycosylase [Eubacteriales bacterium]|nr:A/G-specific adenine glycosylase [Eubacteriales bacterium]